MTPIRLSFLIAMVIIGLFALATGATAQQCNQQCLAAMSKAPSWDARRQCCTMPAAQMSQMAQVPMGQRCVTPQRTCTLYQPSRVDTACSCPSRLLQAPSGRVAR